MARSTTATCPTTRKSTPLNSDDSGDDADDGTVARTVRTGRASCQARRVRKISAQFGNVSTRKRRISRSSVASICDSSSVRIVADSSIGRAFLREKKKLEKGNFSRTRETEVGRFYRRLTFYVFYRFAKEANGPICDFFLKYCRKIDR